MSGEHQVPGLPVPGRAGGHQAGPGDVPDVEQPQLPVLQHQAGSSVQSDHLQEVRRWVQYSTLNTNIQTQGQEAAQLFVFLATKLKFPPD